MIPEEVTSTPQWVNWKEAKRRKRNGSEAMTKVPCDEVGTPIDVTNPTNFRTYTEACNASDHIGFVLTRNDPFIVIDLDKCVVDLEPTEEAMEVVREFNSYTEYSVSGTGLHIFVKGVLPEGWRRNDKIEIYDQDRYMIVTSMALPGFELPVEDRSEEITAWHTKNSKVAKQKIKQERVDSRISDLEWPADPEVTLDAFEALCENVDKFRASWERRRTKLADQSASTYCLSLASMAVRAGWSDQEVVNLVRKWRLKHNEDEKPRSWYLKFCLDPARRSAADDDPPETPEQSSKFLSDILDCYVEGLAKYIGDPPTYALRTDGFGEVDLGDSSGVMKFHKFRERIFERLDILIDPIKTGLWNSIVTSLLESVTIVDLGAESTETGFVESIIVDYLTAQTPRQINDASILVGEPVFDPDLRLVMVQAGFVAKWAARQARSFANLSVPARKITVVLRKLHGTRRTIHAGGTTRSVWTVPKSILSRVPSPGQGITHEWVECLTDDSPDS